VGYYRLLLGQPHHIRFDRQPRNLVHRHTFFEPCLVLSGTGEFEHGGTRHKLRAGDLFLADVGVYHEIRSLTTRDLELYFTSFAVTEIEDPRRSRLSDDQLIRAFLHQHSVWKPGQDHLAGYFRWLLEYNRLADVPQRGFIQEEAMRLLVLQIMAALVPRGAALPEVPRDEKLQTTLDRVVREIDARMHEPIWTGKLARSCGLSERSLRRMFRQRLNRTVAEEIQQRRIQRAATLLALPEFTIAEAAGRVGIPDPAQFSRVFKQVMGVSPRAYRASQTPPPSERTLFTKVGGVAMRTEFLENTPAGTSSAPTRRRHVGTDRRQA
jgi:AraC family L-rhamnose operon transcriptional activator RhaR